MFQQAYTKASKDKITLDEFESRYNQFSAETIELIKKQERERIFNQGIEETVKEIEKYMKEKVK